MPSHLRLLVQPIFDRTYALRAKTLAVERFCGRTAPAKSLVLFDKKRGIAALLIKHSGFSINANDPAAKPGVQSHW